MEEVKHIDNLIVSRFDIPKTLYDLFNNNIDAFGTYPKSFLLNSKSDDRARLLCLFVIFMVKVFDNVLIIMDSTDEVKEWGRVLNGAIPEGEDGWREHRVITMVTVDEVKKYFPFNDFFQNRSPWCVDDRKETVKLHQTYSCYSYAGPTGNVGMNVVGTEENPIFGRTWGMVIAKPSRNVDAMDWMYLYAFNAIASKIKIILNTTTGNVERLNVKIAQFIYFMCHRPIYNDSVGSDSWGGSLRTSIGISIQLRNQYTLLDDVFIDAQIVSLINKNLLPAPSTPAVVYNEKKRTKSTVHATTVTKRARDEFSYPSSSGQPTLHMTARVKLHMLPFQPAIAGQFEDNIDLLYQNVSFCRFRVMMLRRLIAQYIDDSGTWLYTSSVYDGMYTELRWPSDRVTTNLFSFEQEDHPPVKRLLIYDPRSCTNRDDIISMCTRVSDEIIIYAQPLAKEHGLYNHIRYLLNEHAYVPDLELDFDTLFPEPFTGITYDTEYLIGATQPHIVYFDMYDEIERNMVIDGHKDIYDLRHRYPLGNLPNGTLVYRVGNGSRYYLSIHDAYSVLVSQVRRFVVTTMNQLRLAFRQQHIEACIDQHFNDHLRYNFTYPRGHYQQMCDERRLIAIFGLQNFVQFFLDMQERPRHFRSNVAKYLTKEHQNEVRRIFRRLEGQTRVNPVIAPYEFSLNRYISNKQLKEHLNEILKQFAAQYYKKRTTITCYRTVDLSYTKHTVQYEELPFDAVVLDAAFITKIAERNVEEQYRITLDHHLLLLAACCELVSEYKLVPFVAHYQPHFDPVKDTLAIMGLSLDCYDGAVVSDERDNGSVMVVTKDHDEWGVVGWYGSQLPMHAFTEWLVNIYQPETVTCTLKYMPTRMWTGGIGDFCTANDMTFELFKANLFYLGETQEYITVVITGVAEFTSARRAGGSEMPSAHQ